MKKRIALFLLVIILAVGCVSAESERAREVEALFFPDGVPENMADTLYILDAEGNEWFIIANHQSGDMRAYMYDEESGKWASMWSGLFWFRADDLRFVQTGDGAFDVESENRDARMRYQSKDRGFELAGWRDGNAWPGDVELTDHAAVFRPDDQSEAVEVQIGDDLRNWLHSFDNLPKTPEDMRARNALCRENVAALMPDWTMGDYGTYNYGEMADAAFWRIENGKLTICRMILENGGAASMRETLAIPLSDSLLERLEKEAFDTLIDVSGDGSTFRKQDAWDQTAIPIPGKIIQNDLQANALVAITERDGNRYAAVAEQDAQGNWTVRESSPLPEGADMDLYHFGDDEIYLEWYHDDEEGGVSFVRTADGAWRLDGVWIDTAEGPGHYWPSWYGLYMEREDYEDWETYYGYAYGTFDFSDLFTIDFDQLPKTTRDAAALVDPSGWAAVKQPDPGEGLPLMDRPDRQGDSLGTFCNGTPLQILEQRGEWTKVRVGADQAMEGWMQTESLIFGEDLRDVSRAFPDLFLREECEGLHPLLTDGKTEAEYGMTGWETVIGVRESTPQLIVMTKEGGVFLTPMNWFWEGNG